MSKLIFKQSLSHLPSLQSLYDLALRCEQTDGYTTKIYWHVLRERQNDNDALDYLCFADNQLIATLNVLFFAESVEITVLIDPAFRRQGIFRKMLHIAFTKLRHYIVTHYTLICNEKAATLLQKCIDDGGINDHYEVEMLAPKKVITPPKQKITLQKAELTDIPVLATIHEQCFIQPNAEAMRKRFSVTLLEPNRRVYLAKSSSGEAIGKIHAREEFNRVYLHDIGIAPAFQGQGYGYALMAEWLNQFAESYTKPVIVEVLGDNTVALRLYTACGFQTINTYQFLKFAFKA